MGAGTSQEIRRAIEAEAVVAVKKMAAIPFFPADEDVRSEIVREVVSMCWDLGQSSWLATKMWRTFKQWPGPAEMRALFCSKYKPADGFEVESSIFPDGVPSDDEQRGLIAGPNPIPALPPGHAFTADGRLEEKCQELAVKTKLS